MTDLNGSTRYYRRRFPQKEKEYNRPMSLPSYFKEMIGDKKKVLIAEIGAGAVNTIGNLWEGVDVHIVASDQYQEEYSRFWKENDKTPIVPIDNQDMENLTYANNTFDIVHCRNAVDHTPNAEKAISEMKRICKKDGFVYLLHFSNQRSRAKGVHYWDIDYVDGNCTFKSNESSFVLKDFNTKKEGDFIISIWQK